MRRSVIALVTGLGFAVLMSACGSGPSWVTPRVGIGGSLAQWQSAYGSDGCSGTCFGPTVGSILGFAQYEFGANFLSGNAYSFSIIFPDHTSVVTVRSDIMKTMPAGSTASPVVVVRDFFSGSFGGTCAMFNVTSPKLATWLDVPPIGDKAGVVGVQLGSISPGILPYYKSSDVYEADIFPGASDPSGCGRHRQQLHEVVPDLIGLRATDAVSKLKLLGFSYQFTSKSGSSGKVVTAQSPHAGVSELLPATVDLTLAALRARS